MGVGSFVTFFSDDDCINPVVVGYWEMAQSNKDGSILVHFLTYQRSFFYSYFATANYYQFLDSQKLAKSFILVLRG